VLSVKRYVAHHETVTHVLLNPVMVAITQLFVRPVVEYSIYPVIGVLSIRETVHVASPVLPAMSWNVNA